MAYEKKNNYPSLKIKGIYNRTGSRQELGLDNSNLEELSLGNWNTIVKDNKILPTTQEEDLLNVNKGRPIQLLFNEFVFPNITKSEQIYDNKSSFFISFLIRKNSENKVTDIRWDHFRSSHDFGWPNYGDEEISYPKNPYEGEEPVMTNAGAKWGEFEGFGSTSYSDWYNKFTYIPYVNPRFNGRGDDTPATRVFKTGLGFIPITSGDLTEEVGWTGIDYSYYKIEKRYSANTGERISELDQFDNLRSMYKRNGLIETISTSVNTRDERGRYGIIKLPSGETEARIKVRDQYIDILRFYCLTPDDPELIQYWFDNNITAPGDNPLAIPEVETLEEGLEPEPTGELLVRDGGVSQIVKNEAGEYGFEFYGLKSDKKINFEDGFGYIKPRPVPPNDDIRLNFWNQLHGFDIELDDVLVEKFKNLTYERELEYREEGWTLSQYWREYYADYGDDIESEASLSPRDKSFEPNSGELLDEDALYFEDTNPEGYWTHEVIVPRQFFMKTEDSPEFEESNSNRYPIIDLYDNYTGAEDTQLKPYTMQYPIKIPYSASYDEEKFGNGIKLGAEGREENKNTPSLWNPTPFGTTNILSVSYNPTRAVNGPGSIAKTEIFNDIGKDFFTINQNLILGAFENTTGYNNLDFVVDTTSQLDNNTPLFYYDNKTKPIEYEKTSYPLKINLNMSILIDDNVKLQAQKMRDGLLPPDFPINLNQLGFQNTLRSESALIDYLYSEVDVFTNSFFYENQIEGNLPYQRHHYRYKVIQWGDEKTLLTDRQIENSFYFKVYNTNSFENFDDFYFKKITKLQTIPLEETSTHTYNTPGVKNIKIIVNRLTNEGSFILQTYLVIKNIVINDGLLSSQDFEIFGGINFNFLPIVENQAIIGGFDVESKYDNSVSKIVKDDSFVQDDYLEKSSAKNYIEKINNGSLGKQPGQLDLGQVRIFKEARDIYDFIGGDKLNWIVSGSDTLPVNSLATDIFIRDNKCVVDLNPSDTEYSAIQNKAGLKEVGVVVGDYKVNQPQGGRIQKQGVMEIPILDTDNEKQAF